MPVAPDQHGGGHGAAPVPSNTVAPVMAVIAGAAARGRPMPASAPPARIASAQG
jgi:hypothetical protein